MAVDYAAIVESIDNAIAAAVANGGVIEYTIAGRGLKRYTLQELWDMRNNYAGLLNAQTAGTCLRQSRAIHCSDRRNRFGC